MISDKLQPGMLLYDHEPDVSNRGVYPIGACIFLGVYEERYWILYPTNVSRSVSEFLINKEMTILE